MLQDRNARALLGFIQSAFAAQTMPAGNITTRESKRHPTADAATGPDAAADYRVRHIRGNSSLRKMMRLKRIEAGKRPLKYDVPGKRERKIALRAAIRAQ